MPYKDPAQQREYQRRWTARRRAQYVDGQTCVSCPTTTGLQLHHRDPAQKVSHRIWTWSHTRIQEELAKCEWVCEECHIERHGGRAEHGSIRRYDAYKCRCSECRAVKAEARLREPRVRK